jgi:hypothetical protein
MNELIVWFLVPFLIGFAYLVLRKITEGDEKREEGEPNMLTLHHWMGRKYDEDMRAEKGKSRNKQA